MWLQITISHRKQTVCNIEQRKRLHLRSRDYESRHAEPERNVWYAGMLQTLMRTKIFKVESSLVWCLPAAVQPHENKETQGWDQPRFWDFRSNFLQRQSERSRARRNRLKEQIFFHYLSFWILYIIIPNHSFSSWSNTKRHTISHIVTNTKAVHSSFISGGEIWRMKMIEQK